MRTFPRSLATFRELVNQRGDRLRSLTFAELEDLARVPSSESINVESRAATISTIIQHREDGSLRVVLQGFMKLRWLPFGKHVAVDGFYKHPGGAVTPMPDREFYEFS